MYALIHVAYAGVVLDESVLPAQTINGATSYPPGHPHEVFYWRALSLSHHLSALIWAAVPDADFERIVDETGGRPRAHRLRRRALQQGVRPADPCPPGNLLGVHPANPESPVPDYLVMVIFVAALLIVMLGLASRGLSIITSKRQSFLELIIQGFDGQLVEIIGEEGRKFLPMIATVGLIVFSANMIGLVPGFMSPTSKLNVTAGCALTVFVYYHWQGMKAQGVLRYLKYFTGPIPALAPLLLPIEMAAPGRCRTASPRPDVRCAVSPLDCNCAACRWRPACPNRTGPHQSAQKGIDAGLDVATMTAQVVRSGWKWGAVP